MTRAEYYHCYQVARASRSIQTADAPRIIVQAGDVRRAAVSWRGKSADALAQLHEYVRRYRVALKAGRGFPAPKTLRELREAISICRG